MVTKLKQWFEPPYFSDDEEKTAQARIMNTVVIYFVLAVLVAAIIFVPFFSNRIVESYVVILMLLILPGITRFFMLRGQLAFACTLLVATVWVMFVGVAMFSGGIASPLMFAIVAVSGITGLLLEPRIGTLFAIASIFVGLGFALLQQGGIVLPQYFVFSPMATWAVFAFALIFMHRLITLVVRILQTALASARQQSEARQQAEQALRHSEFKFRTIVEQSSEGIALVDEDGITIEWNHANEKITGLKRDQVLGMPYWDMVLEFMPPAQLSASLRGTLQSEILDALRTGKSWLFDHPIEATTQNRLNGNERHLLVAISPIKIEKGYRIVFMTRDITERKQREHELESIATLSAALRLAETRAAMLPVILNQVLDLLKVEGAMLVIRNLATGELTVELGSGEWADRAGAHLSLDKSTSGQVIISGQRYVCNEVQRNSLSGYPDLSGELNCVACVPLMVQEQTFGALCVGQRTTIGENELRLLTSIADIAANAIHRATLHEETRKYATDLAQAYDTTLEGWAHALELRDQETEGHSRRVMQLTFDLAQAMGIGEEAMENIRRGVLLHDIGKMGIPDSVLLKPGTLNEREWEIMRRHPEYAYNLLMPIDYLRKAIEIPYCHHEKWDGTGYPLGLKEEAIPLAARIFAIADVWDALTSDRPYRKAWAKETALKYIHDQSGKHFDPQVVEVFLRKMQSDIDKTE